MMQHGYPRDEVSRLFDILDSRMGMTDELHEVFQAEVIRLEEELHMALISPTELKGIKKGRLEGRLEALREMAGRMAAEGMDLSTISRLLKVPEPEVTAWLGAACKEAEE